MKKPIQLFILLFFISLKVAFSQEDYIVINQKDTLWGKVHSNKNFEVSFSKIGYSTTQEYAANDVVSYYIASENQEFQSVKLEGKKEKIFMQCLEKGKIRLFECQFTKVYGYPARPITVTTWYAMKDCQLFEVKTNGIFANGQKGRASFNSLLADNIELTQKYPSKKRYRFDEIKSIIKEYNLP
jgi:hypothetical protein